MNVKYLVEIVNEDALGGGQHLPMSRSLEDESRKAAYEIFDDAPRKSRFEMF